MNDVWANSEPGNAATSEGASCNADSPSEQAIADSVIVDTATDEVLRLHLDKFEGPCEVLLYLIKSQEIDIFDIPIVTITEQYLAFLELMREESLDVTSEFLVMAATLIHIKSKMLLPDDTEEEDEEFEEEEDPRLELVEKLLEYRKFRHIAAKLEMLEEERQKWHFRVVKPRVEAVAEDDDYLEVTLQDLIKAFRSVARFLADDIVHAVEKETASVDEMIDYIENLLAHDQSVAWLDLFRGCKSRMEMVCSFLAILELCRMGKVRAHQHRIFGDIRLFPCEAAASAA